MRNSLSSHIGFAINAVVLGVFALFPLLFLPIFTEYYETPKILMLIFSSLLVLLLTVLKWVIEGRVTFTKTPLDLALILFMIIIVLSTIFSAIPYTSLFGSLPKIHGSAISWIFYILFYFVATSSIQNKNWMLKTYYALLCSSILVCAVTILSYFQFYKLLESALPVYLKLQNFSPAGSSFSAAALAALMLPLPLLSLFKYSARMPVPVALFSSTIFLLTIALVGNFSTYAAALTALAACSYISRNKSNNTHYMENPAETRKRHPLGFFANNLVFFIPVAVALFVVFLSFIPSTKKLTNPFYGLRKSLPSEPQLPFVTSWKISASAFRDKPFLGTGPSTYLFDFTEYKPREYNSANLWSLRFDSAHNELFHTLATLGGLGVLGLVFWLFLATATGIRTILEKEDLLTVSLGISVLISLVIFLLHSTSSVFLFASFGILTLLMVGQKLRNSPEKLAEDVVINLKSDRVSYPADTFLLLLLFFPLLLLTVYIAWNATPKIRAEYYHRLALNSATASRGLDTYNHLIKAIQLNPQSDLYRIDLAQTNFALANAIARQKGPTESSPGGSLTEQDKKNIQSLISQSIQAGQAGTALNPLNAQNWEVLASIYRQISGIAQNATGFALDAYGRAMQRDPFNPILRLQAGGIYYSAKNYEMAANLFRDAVNLKPDLPSGYYNLSVTLRDKGDLQNAIAVAEKAVSLIEPLAPDYKPAADYLADLKARQATQSSGIAGTGQAQPAAKTGKVGQTAPLAAEETSPLQKQGLPNVIDLPKKENIASPPAIKKE